jgi:hypothetical protein
MLEFLADENFNNQIVRGVLRRTAWQQCASAITTDSIGAKPLMSQICFYLDEDTLNAPQEQLSKK